MKIRFIVLALVLATAIPAFAAGAEDWDGLKSDYTQLRKYMSSKRRIGPDERTALSGLLERLDVFIAANPDDRRALAMDISVSTWLGRTERVERDYEMLAQLTDSDAVWLAWAKMRLAENRYDEAGAMARSRPYDFADRECRETSSRRPSTRSTRSPKRVSPSPESERTRTATGA